MKARIHISQPSGHKNTQLSRTWSLPNEFKDSIVTLLGGHPYQPNSIPIQPGYSTQSRATIPLPTLLNSLGRDYLELPGGKGIEYKQAIEQGGFEFLFEKKFGAWKFTRIIDILLHGYTSEEVDPINSSIRSIGDMRKFSLVRHDGGSRYLVKYSQEDQRMDDLQELYTFGQDPEAAQKKCCDLDDFEAQIF